MTYELHKKQGNHTFNDSLPDKYPGEVERDLSYRFYTHFHPYAGKLTERIIRQGTKKLQSSDTEYDPKSVKVTGKKRRPVKEFFDDKFFEDDYQPAEVVRRPYPVKDLDFSSNGAYSVYNWELFFHIPITIAIHLSKNHRFAEAQHWFHYIFDPTDDSSDPAPDRFWKVREFHSADIKTAEEILINLVTKADFDLWKATVKSIDQWKNEPFRPHIIARYRHSAYMQKTVMAYQDNLIAWGDSLFRQDTGEAIDEALMLYVLAADILGARPQPVPKKGSIRPQTYANLRKDLKEFGTAMRGLEAAVGFDSLPFPEKNTEQADRQTATVRNLSKALYFCVPRNDKMLGYWDTVADRLFKIRNSLNFQGVFRQLALFEPPIDPGMLARAVAAGLDISSIVNGLNQPLPLVRFQLLVQKATELAQEVKSLGNSLLSAMEKEDGETIALLRAKHERVMMEMVEHVKFGQLQEAVKSREGLLQSLALAIYKYSYYEQQLGKKPDEIEIPELEELDKESLDKMKFSMEEPGIPMRDIEVDIAPNLEESDGMIVSTREEHELDKLSDARDLQDVVKGIQLGAQAVSMIPEFGIKFHFWGLGGDLKSGGPFFAKTAEFASNVTSAVAGKATYEAGRAAKTGGYSRREQDWSFQSNLIAGEITQTFKQIRAAEIREAIAELDLKNHRKQMEHAKEIEHFLNEEGANRKGKKTNKALYTWMKREVKGLYGQCFQFAFDVAKKAERALQHELGKPELNYLQFGYLSGKQGLLAGEKLYLDIKRMEMAYHEQNQREYELTKHISLLQIDPLALVQLRTTGSCTVQLPESLFDMDGPGHFFRRIKNVALSIPCVTGPYASVNCTLTLLKSSIRKSPALQDDQYARADSEDNRFSDHFGSLQSIVTSSAQNDNGLFEANLHDERYLPFENSGVISEWHLELPANPAKGDPCQFDYDTISDVVLHMRYTAREGGKLIGDEAKKSIFVTKASGTIRLFSVRHEFPSEWAKFTKKQVDENGKYKLKIKLRSEHYPFWMKNYLENDQPVSFLAKKNGLTVNVKTGKATLNEDERYGDLYYGDLKDDSTEKELFSINPKGILEMSISDKELDDLWIAIRMGGLDSK